MICKRLALLADVQYGFYSAQSAFKAKLDYANLMKDITGKRELVQAMAYVVQPNGVNQEPFFNILTRLGFDLRVKHLKRDDKRSCGIALTVDAMQLLNRVEVITIMSGDGDLLPLVEAIKGAGVRIEIAGFKGTVSNALLNVVDEFIEIGERHIFLDKKQKEESEKKSLFNVETQKQAEFAASQGEVIAAVEDETKKQAQFAAEVTLESKTE